jgi:hypothetical protein
VLEVEVTLQRERDWKIDSHARIIFSLLKNYISDRNRCKISIGTAIDIDSARQAPSILYAKLAFIAEVTVLVSVPEAVNH